jgi:hypothetical protein
MRLRLFLGVSALGLAASLPARAAPLPAPAPEFQAAINGQPLQLHDFLEGNFGLFEVAGPAEGKFSIENVAGVEFK